MRIAAYLPLSLCDYPGRVAAVVFTRGCNFRCPWCHNRHLIPPSAPAGESDIDERTVLDGIEERKSKLEGLVISGGEPTLQPDLLRFMAAVKSCGVNVKLDTNGSNPDVVRQCLADKLVDFIAMDVKAPWDKYEILTGVVGSDDAARETMKLIAESGIKHQFRTTKVPSLLTAEDCAEITSMIPSGSPHCWQTFRPTPDFKG